MRVMIVGEKGADIHLTKEALNSFNGSDYKDDYRMDIYESYSGKVAVTNFEKAAEKEQTFDVIFITQKMQGFSGVQTAITISSKKNIPTPPMILMCEQMDDRVKDGAEKAGIKGFVMIPVDKEKVEEALFKLMDLKIDPIMKNYEAKGGGMNDPEDEPDEELISLCDATITQLRKTLDFAPWYKRPYALIAACAMEMHDFKGAIMPLRAAIRIDVKDQELHAKLKDCYQKVGQHKADLTDLKDMLMKNPKSSEVNLKVGDAFYLDGEPEKALRFFENGVKNLKEDDPSRVKAKNHWGLGRALMAFDQSDDALERARKELEDAVNKGPLMPGPKLSLAKLYRQLDMESEAKDMERQANAQDPDNAPDWLDLFFLYLEEQDIKKAKNALRNAVRLDPVNPLLFFLAGEAYVRQRMWKEAIEQFDASLELYPSDIRTYNFLGICNRNLGKLDEAAKNYAEALNIDPEDYNVIYNLGKAQFQADNKEDALARFQEALSLNPELTYAEEGIKLCEKAMEESGRTQMDDGEVLADDDEIDLTEGSSGPVSAQ